MNKIYVLIDNDLLIRKSWEFASKKSSVNLSTFPSVEKFLAQADQFSKDTHIFIDLELDDGLRGDIESKKIADLGFKLLFLATGHDCSNMKLPVYILKAVGKRAPF